MKYRSEIDGLRAVAVIPVILFHAGFAPFGGGYIGVDVFFVISGYLITTILIDDLERGAFSIAKFYERRARRILPALFFVMLATIPFAWMWLLPSEMAEYSRSMVAVSLFVSNIFFWQESGYFDTATEEKPLLHTWSLAVEEQYYLLFPVFLFLLWRYGRNRVFLSIVVLAAISCVLGEWGSRRAASATFYLAPTRAWELFAGSIAAFIVHDRGIRKNETLALVGLLAIIVPVFVYDANTPIPGIFALPPILGVVLLILFAERGTFVAKLLSQRVVVGMGLISYSAYLWHQPVFAFARIRSLEPPSPALMAALGLLSIALAVFSWRFVEQPFRKGAQGLVPRRQTVFALSLVGLVGFSALGLAGNAQGGWPGRFQMAPSLVASFDRTTRTDACFDRTRVHLRDDWLCDLGDVPAGTDFVVFGDSHALSLLDAFDDAARLSGTAGRFTGASGCAPLLGIHSLRGDQGKRNCHALNQRVFDFVRDNDIPVVFLVSRWTYYTDGGYDGEDFSFIGPSPDAPKLKQASRETFREGLARTVEAFASIGTKVLFVEQIPQQMVNPSKFYAFAAQDAAAEIGRVSTPVTAHRSLNDFVMQAFQSSGAEVLSFDDIFCDNNVCPLGTAETSYYFDADHLSLTGAARMVPRLAPLLEGAKRPR